MTVCGGSKSTYLHIRYDCELPVYTETVCEGETFHPSCMAGLEMQIVATYGRTDGSTCRVAGKDTTGRCEADDAHSKLAQLCKGREWCAIKSDNAYFGNITTCPGTSKYLKAEFTCA